MTIALHKVEQLINECKELGINIDRHSLPNNIKGLYYADSKTEPVIAIDFCVDTQSETYCVIAEELGHYQTSCGNLLTDKAIDNVIVRKQETRAKRWAYEKLVSLDKLISAYESGVRDRYALAAHLDITDEFLEVSLKYYKVKHGLYSILGNYIIYFEPFGIFKMFE